MIRLKVIACEVVARELYYAAAGSRNAVDIVLLPQGLHDNSDLCRSRLQELIDAPDPDRYDAVLLGYGLCNNAVAGVRAGTLPLIIPRAHDCITLLLGSKERYAKLFGEVPGTYWYSSGWLECRHRRGDRIEPRQNSGLGPLYKGAEWDGLVAKYGEDNARYLIEFMGHWEDHYTRGVLIEFDFTRHLRLDDEVRRICREKGWEFLTVAGDLALIRVGLDGPWDDGQFLTLDPGCAVRPSYNETVIAAEPAPHAPPGCSSGRKTP